MAFKTHNIQLCPPVYCEGRPKSESTARLLRHDESLKLLGGDALPTCSTGPLAGTRFPFSYTGIFPFGIRPKTPGGRPVGYTMNLVDAMAGQMGFQPDYVFAVLPWLVCVRSYYGYTFTRSN